MHSENIKKNTKKPPTTWLNGSSLTFPIERVFNFLQWGNCPSILLCISLPQEHSYLTKGVIHISLRMSPQDDYLGWILFCLVFCFYLPGTMKLASYVINAVMYWCENTCVYIRIYPLIHMYLSFSIIIRITDIFSRNFNFFFFGKRSRIKFKIPFCDSRIGTTFVYPLGKRGNTDHMPPKQQQMWFLSP